MIFCLGFFTSHKVRAYQSVMGLNIVLLSFVVSKSEFYPQL